MSTPSEVVIVLIGELLRSLFDINILCLVAYDVCPRQRMNSLGSFFDFTIMVFSIYWQRASLSNARTPVKKAGCYERNLGAGRIGRRRFPCRSQSREETFGHSHFESGMEKQRVRRNYFTAVAFTLT